MVLLAQKSCTEWRWAAERDEAEHHGEPEQVWLCRPHPGTRPCPEPGEATNVLPANIL